MSKFVAESIEELREYKKHAVNEGVFSNIISSIKRFFKRLGQFFFFKGEDGKVQGAIAPVNIGIMVKNNILPNIYYLPSPEDRALDKSLKSNVKEYISSLKESAGKYNNEKLNEARVPLEHPNKDVVNVNKKSLMRRIRIILKKRGSTSKDDSAIPLLIWGAPGIGKTQIINGILKEAMNENIRLAVVPVAMMQPDDFALPYVYKKEGDEFKAVDIPKSWLPVYVPTGDPKEDQKRNDIANMGGGGILFFDELSRANAAVQNASLKLIDERKIGEAILGDKWVIISAANRHEDDPDSDQSFSNALGNRFTQVNYVPTFKEWKEWGVTKGNIDQRILDFIELNADYFYTLDDESPIFASPRSWEHASKNLSDLYKDAEEEGYRVTLDDVREFIGSDVGAKIGDSFVTFLRLLDTFSKEDLQKVFKSPEKAPLPRRAGSGYVLDEANSFLTLVVSSTRGKQLTPEEFNNFIKYLIKLDNATLAQRAFMYMDDIQEGLITKEQGDYEGHDMYKEGVDMFIEKYGEILSN